MDQNSIKTMFSSNSDEWATPQDFFDKLNNIYNFTLDPCATKENTKCKKYFTIEDDGLKQSWKGETVFMNIPYSQTNLWVKKAYEEFIDNNTTSVILMPSRTDTKYFHEYIINKAGTILFVKGRLKFGNSKNSAPFPSMIVIFNDNSAFIYNKLHPNDPIQQLTLIKTINAK